MLYSLRNYLSGLLISLISLAAPFPALADATNFPQRPIRFVVPYSAGGGSDVVARRIADSLSKRLGVSIVVENRPGANGVIGVNTVAQAAPDGYTYAIASGTHLLNPFMQPQMPYDTANDLVGVTMIARIPLIFVTKGDSPASDLATLFHMIKQNPERYTMASAENYGHLLNVILTSRHGIDLPNIPYSGSSPMQIDIASGVTTFGATSFLAAHSYFQSGRLKPLAVSGSSRSTALPDVATVVEQGLGDFDFYNAYGLYAPAGTPMAILDRMQKEIRAVLEEPGVRNMLSQQAAEPVGDTPEEFNNHIRQQLAMFEELTQKYPLQQ